MSAAAPLEEEAQKYVTGPITPESDSKEDKVKAAEKEVLDAAAALAGASDIIAEKISDEPDYRTYIRDITVSEGKIAELRVVVRRWLLAIMMQCLLCLKIFRMEKR